MHSPFLLANGVNASSTNRGDRYVRMHEWYNSSSVNEDKIIVQEPKFSNIEVDSKTLLYGHD